MNSCWRRTAFRSLNVTLSWQSARTWALSPNNHKEMHSANDQGAWKRPPGLIWEWWPQTKAVFQPVGRDQRNQLTRTQTPELWKLWGDEFVFFKLVTVWWFVIAARENVDTHSCAKLLFFFDLEFWSLVFRLQSLLYLWMICHHP